MAVTLSMPGSAGSAMFDTPALHGQLGWTFPPVMSNAGNNPFHGSMYMCKVVNSGAGVLATVWVYVTVAGAILTAGQNFIGVYNAAGTLLGATADQTAAWGGTGLLSAALTVQGGQSLAVGSGQILYVGILSNGTTTPTFAELSGRAPQLTNENQAASADVSGTTGAGGLTALPATVTMSGLTQANDLFWAAVG